MEEKRYIAIDLKSFYASVECAARGLDPLGTNLVVADESRTEKTICLAVSPSLKAYGIRRSRRTAFRAEHDCSRCTRSSAMSTRGGVLTLRAVSFAVLRSSSIFSTAVRTCLLISLLPDQEWLCI